MCFLSDPNCCTDRLLCSFIGVGSQASGIAIPLSLLIYLKLLKIQAIASDLGLGIC